MLGLFAVDVVPRERFHKSSKFAEVGLAGVGEVVAERTPPCCRGGEEDKIEVLML